MLKLYILNCSELNDEQILACVIPLLPPKRQDKVQRLQTQEKKSQSAAAGLLIRHLFGDADISYGANGKPYIANQPNLHFNISHTGSYVVCAVSDSDVGVDVESIASIKPVVLKRCFTEQEQLWIGNSPLRFSRLWTMKEAYMKLLGTGFSLAPKDIHLTMPPQEGYDSAHNCYWQFFMQEVPITVCSRSDCPAEVIHTNIKDLL